MVKPELSIIIVSYNTQKLLVDCLTSVYKYSINVNIEVIVVDNASKDDSVQIVRSKFPQVNLIESKKNLGFAKGNNLAKSVAKGKYVLFLNSDTLVTSGVFAKTLEKIESDPRIGALGCKIVLPSGKLDRDSRRSFPTPWVAFTHFSGLDKIRPRSKILSRYWYGYLSQDETHEVDVLQGAYMLCRKSVLDHVGWFDEDYFLDGEDIDLCWKIKTAGYKLLYYQETSIVHVKKASKKSPTKDEREKIVKASVESMELFYKKRMSMQYPALVTVMVLIGIKLMMVIRGARVRL